MISTQVALSGAGGQVGESARRTVVARATDAALKVKGRAGAKKAKKREANRGYADASRKRAKGAAEAVAQEEAQLVERVRGLLVDLGRDGSKVLDDDGDDGDEFGGLLETKGYKADVAALARLEADENTDALTIKRKRNAIAAKRTKARKKASLDKARRRVALLKIRVEALEEELRAPAPASA